METGILPTSHPVGIKAAPLGVKWSFDVVPRLRMHGALCPVDRKLLCAILFDVNSTILQEIWSKWCTHVQIQAKLISECIPSANKSETMLYKNWNERCVNTKESAVKNSCSVVEKRNSFA